MAKDRARPFSRKHRKYWITVTGGMLVIGAINVGLGWSSYETPPPPPTPIIPVLPVEEVPPGTVSLGEVPVPVVQAFTEAFPRMIPRRARKLVAADGQATYELTFGAGEAVRRATFAPDGTVLSGR